MTEKCVACAELFPSPTALEQHRKRAHPTGSRDARSESTTSTVLTTWSCPLCDDLLPSEEVLRAHCVRPHYRSNRTIARTVRYSAA
jgi:hypothetical protein